jgi:hypothetical protein
LVEPGEAPQKTQITAGADGLSWTKVGAEEDMGYSWLLFLLLLLIWDKVMFLLEGGCSRTGEVVVFFFLNWKFADVFLSTSDVEQSKRVAQSRK